MIIGHVWLIWYEMIYDIWMSLWEMMFRLPMIWYDSDDMIHMIWYGFDDRRIQIHVFHQLLELTPTILFLLQVAAASRICYLPSKDQGHVRRVPKWKAHGRVFCAHFYSQNTHRSLCKWVGFWWGAVWDFIPGRTDILNNSTPKFWITS